MSASAAGSRALRFWSATADREQDATRAKPGASAAGSRALRFWSATADREQDATRAKPGRLYVQSCMCHVPLC